MVAGTNHVAVTERYKSKYLMNPVKSLKPSTRREKGVSLTKIYEKDTYEMGTLV